MSIKEKVLKEKDYREIEKMKETIILAKKEILDLRSEAIDLVNKGIIIGRNEALEEKKKQVDGFVDDLKKKLMLYKMEINDEKGSIMILREHEKRDLIDEKKLEWFPDLKEPFLKNENVN